MGAPIPEQSNAAAEQRAREYLAQGRFRKARDEFKVLCKVDRVRYLPGLIQANVGLAKEMLAKGMTSEAGQVIAYLKTIAPPDQVRGLEFEVAIKSGRPEDCLAGVVEALLRPSATLADAQKIRLADQIIVTFKEWPAQGEADVALAAEVRAVHQALEAVSQEQWERAAECLRPLPQASLFNHWKLFIKGLAAFYRGDLQKAASAFDRLPTGSVPAKASQPFLVFARPEADAAAGDPVAESRVVAFCRLMGQPSLGTPLVAAEGWWKARDYPKSYEALRTAVAAFPSDAPDGLGVLSDFFFSAPLSTSKTDRESWVDYVNDLIDEGEYKNRVEKRRVFRLATFHPAMCDGLDGLRDDLEEFLETHQQLYGKNPRFESLALLWLAGLLAPDASATAHAGYAERRPKGSQKAARELLERSVALDPDNLPAHLKLCRVLEASKKKAEHNRLLDAMAVRFPDDPAVLLQAGRSCVERKAFQKGFQYLERAAELDRINPAVKDALVMARQEQARQFYREQRLDKARETLAANDPLLVDDPLRFTRAKWTHRIAEGLLELYQGDSQAAGPKMAEARQGSPSSEAFLLYAELFFATLPAAKKMASPYLKEWRKLRKQASAKNAGLLMRLVEYWPTRQGQDCHQGERWIESYLQDALKQPFTRKEVLDLAAHAVSQAYAVNPLVKFLDRLLKRDGRDPAVRMARYDLLTPRHLDPRTRRELEEIIRDATQREDHQSLRQATQLLERLKTAPPPLPAFPAWPGDDFASPEDEFEDEFDAEFGVGPGDVPDEFADFINDPGMAALPDLNQAMYEALIGMLPAKQRSGFEDLVWDLSGVPDFELAARLKHPPKDIPPMLVTMMGELARQMRVGNIRPTWERNALPPPPRAPAQMPKPKPPSVPMPQAAAKPPARTAPSPPPAPKPKPVRPPPEDDPNQMDLF